MKQRIIKVPLSVRGIDRAIEAVKEYQQWLKERTEVLLDRLAQEGYTLASAKFASAIYDGTNDTSVRVETDRKSVV